MTTPPLCVAHGPKNEFAFDTKQLKQILCSLSIASANRIATHKYTKYRLVIGRINIVLAISCKPFIDVHDLLCNRQATHFHN